MRALGGFLLQFIPVMLSAESRFSSSNSSVSFQQVGSWVASLLLVLAIFLLCVWVIRKSRHWMAVPARQLRIVTGLALGMREKLILVQVGDKQVLLGVTPGRIDKLLELEGDEQIETDVSTARLEPFAQKLAQVMKKGQ